MASLFVFLSSICFVSGIVLDAVDTVEIGQVWSLLVLSKLGKLPFLLSDSHRLTETRGCVCVLAVTLAPQDTSRLIIIVFWNGLLFLLQLSA